MGTRSRITNKAPSSIQDIRDRLYRNIEVDGLVFQIRRIPVARYDALVGNDEANEILRGVKGTDQQFKRFEEIARAGLVDQGIPWEDLSFRAQTALVAEILSFTTEGMKEVGEALDTFRHSDEGGAANGAARPGPAAAGSADDEAAPVAGSAASSS